MARSVRWILCFNLMLIYDKEFSFQFFSVDFILYRLSVCGDYIARCFMSLYFSYTFLNYFLSLLCHHLQLQNIICYVPPNGNDHFLKYLFLCDLSAIYCDFWIDKYFLVLYFVFVVDQWLVNFTFPIKVYSH